MSLLQRLHMSFPKTMTLTTSSSPATDGSDIINYAVWAGATLHIVGASITTLTFYVSDKTVGEEKVGGGSTVVSDLVFDALVDKTGTAVTRTVAAGQATPMPDECFGAGSVRIKANAAGIIRVSLKG